MYKAITPLRSLVVAAGLCLALVPAFGTLGAAMAVGPAAQGRAAPLAPGAGRIPGPPPPVLAAGGGR